VATNGRMTPVRVRNGDANFTTANAMWGYETPTNKILNNVPVTVTNRSSERRKRMKIDGNGVSEFGDKTLGTGFVDARSAKVRTPTFDVAAPLMRERSNSNASAKSENVFLPRQLTKVSSFSSDRPLSKPLQPTSKNNNFFHANEQQETRPFPGDPPELFFFAANKVRNIPSPTPLNASRQRRLSNSSQYSTFSTAKEACEQNGDQNTVSLLHQVRSPISPISPTKTNFHNVSGPITRKLPPENILPKEIPSSPLRSSSVISPLPSPSKQSPTPEEVSHESTSLSSTTSATQQLSSDTSEDDLTTKSLLPTPVDLEHSARINRKVIPLPIVLILDCRPRNFQR